MEVLSNQEVTSDRLRRIGFYLQLLGGAAIAAIIVIGPLAYISFRKPTYRNFRVVDEGKLYRTAQLNEAGLERVILEYGIRTVVSLRYADDGEPSPPDEWEEQVCQRLGVQHVRIRPGYHEGDHGEKNARVAYDRFIELMRNPNNHPVLIHCFRGVHRTGCFCAVYRMNVQKWSNEEAIQELIDFGYDKLKEESDVYNFMKSYRP
ncbi:MAG: tyrosine-protein phosphatase [Zavarzinella sp.]